MVSTTNGAIATVAVKHCALAGKQASWIVSMGAEVGEHRVCAVGAFVVDILAETACELVQSWAAEVGRPWRFALAGDGRVVLVLKAHRAG